MNNCNESGQIRGIGLPEDAVDAALVKPTDDIDALVRICLERAQAILRILENDSQGGDFSAPMHHVYNAICTTSAELSIARKFLSRANIVAIEQ